MDFAFAIDHLIFLAVIVLLVKVFWPEKKAKPEPKEPLGERLRPEERDKRHIP